MKILSEGILENSDQLMELADECGQVVIPDEGHDADLTHWWVIRDDGEQVLYVGTPETFTTYIKETGEGLS